jgi:hypothetical protein
VKSLHSWRGAASFRSETAFRVPLYQTSNPSQFFFPSKSLIFRGGKLVTARNFCLRRLLSDLFKGAFAYRSRTVAFQTLATVDQCITCHEDDKGVPVSFSILRRIFRSICLSRGAFLQLTYRVLLSSQAIVPFAPSQAGPSRFLGTRHAFVKSNH